MSRAFIQKRLPFKPTDIGGCQLWLDGADATSTGMTLSGTSVISWNDKSGNAYNLTQGSSGSQPSYSANLITFSSNKYLNIPQAVMNNAATWSLFFVINPISSSNWIMVKQRDGQNTYNVLSMTINTNSGGGGQTGSTGFLYWRSFNAGSQAVSTAALTTSTLQICNLTYDGTNLYFYKNGVLEKTTSGTFAIQNDTNATNYTLGVWIQSGVFINSGVTNFQFGELNFYSSFLNLTQRQQIEAYLAQKWGLRQQLPQGHPGTRGIVYPSDPVNLLVRVPYSSAFVPTSISNCSMWLDGADPAGTGVKPSNGATVSTWIDKSGSGINLTAVGTPTYATASSSVYLNGGSYLQNTNFNFTNYTIFFVSNQASDSGPLYTNNTTTAGYSGFFPRYSNGSYYLVQSDSGWLSAGSPFSNGTTYLYSIQYDSLNNINLWSNGSISPTITGTAGTITRDKFLLGKRSAGQFSENMTGNVFEVVQYNSDLGQTARQQLEGYLAWKWGLQANLPANHPYKNASPNTPNQFGISRPANVLPIPPITISARSRPIVQVLISSGLLVRYRMNESSGSTVIDSIAGNNITIGGSPSRVSTTYSSYTGYALSIQNATQYGYITLPANMVVGAHSITSWVYFTGFSSDKSITWTGWGSGCKGENYFFYNNNTPISIISGGPSCIAGLNFLDNNTNAVSPQLNTWYFCVTTWDGSTTWKTYCYSPTTAYTFTFSYGMNAVTSSGIFAIGISNNLNAEFGGTGHGGYIGEVRFYNRVLTAGEVASIYAGTG